MADDSRTVLFEVLSFEILGLEDLSWACEASLQGPDGESWRASVAGHSSDVMCEP